MILLTVEEVLMLHDKLIATTGGMPGLREIGLLESAVYSMHSGYDDVEIYPTIEEKAARLTIALISDHAFVDGNKRIGILALLTTLRLNQISLRYTQQELIALGLGVASGALGYEQIYRWILFHRVES